MARNKKNKPHAPKPPKKMPAVPNLEPHHLNASAPAQASPTKPPTSPTGAASLSWLDRWVWMGMMVLIGWVFWGALGGEALKWDDNKYLNPQENRALQAGWAGLWVAWSSTFDNSWYPVLQTWFWLAARIAEGLGVSVVQVIKAGNGLLTLGGAWLFWRILVWRVRLVSCIACLLVGVVWLHPLRVESFAWASNARDTVSLFLLMWSLDAYLRGARTWWGWALLAALSKTSVVLMPLCFPLVAGLLEGAHPKSENAQNKQPKMVQGTLLWAVVAGVLLMIGVLGYREVVARNCLLEEGWAGHLGAVACLQARYVARIFSLAPPVAIPTVPWSCGWGWVQGLCFVGWLGLGGAALWLREGVGRWFSVGVAWWFCAMLPIAGVIPIAFPIADRYTLLPMVGITLIVGAWWRSVMRARSSLAKPRHAWLLWFAFSCVIGMGMYTRHAVAIWQTDEQLWSYNARLVPNEWAVFLNLGGTSGGKGDFPKARAALERAWLLAPHRYLVLQSLFLARAVVLEPKVGVSLHRAFLFARNDREKLKQMLMSPYIYRHAPLISLIRFRIKSLDQPPKPTEACRDERESRWRLHPDHPQRSARSAW